MSEETEPKNDELDIDGKIDELEKELSGEQSENQNESVEPSTEESSPQEDATTETKDEEAETSKTEKSEESSEDDKGFASHPAWIKRETKLKEAREEADRLKQEKEFYDSLLNDKDVYQKYLQRKGHTDSEIRQKLEEKGFEVEKPKDNPMFERVAKRLNWDVNSLSQDQKKQINDYIAMQEAVSEEIVSERTKDLRSHVDNANSKMMLEAAVSRAKKLADKEGVNWDMAEKAMNDYLIERDKRTGRKDFIDPEELYQLATRDISKFKTDANERKEERNKLKSNNRPLTPSGAGPTNKEKKFEGNTASVVDQFLDSVGFKE